jgi:PPOX class probable F420-dependent enzyme
VYTTVDAKPKTTTRLQRLRDIEAEPRVALLADHYAEDWDTLWWARAEGVATVLARPGDLAEPLRLLATRYPQYRAQPPGGPVISVRVERWTGWSAGPG